MIEMPSASEQTTAKALRTREGDRRELVVDRENSDFHPGRWQFENEKDLVRYLSETLGIPASSGALLSGSISRKGSYSRRRPDGTRAVTFGDPILDQITSPLGEIVIGGQVMNLARSVQNFQSPSVPTGFLAADLVLTGEELGVERWASLDGSRVEYRTETAALIFEAFKETKYWLGHKRIGARITTRSSVFEAANIDSRYYMNVYAQVCAVDIDSDHDRNDDYLDEYDWAILGNQAPQRVESLCRAQWNGERYADVVAIGEECFAVGDVTPFPTEWPEDWPSDSGLTVRPRHLNIRVKSAGLVGRGTITVTNHDPFDASINVSDAEGVNFQNNPGPATVPANGSCSVQVTFVGHASGTSSVRIVADDGRTFVVPITATVDQQGQPL
jgi:hypothetical protein